MQAEQWISALDLQPHPEGGWYREVYRAGEGIQKAALPERFSGDRTFATSIYYLLSGSDFSALHRINQDELWHFYDGDGLSIHVISRDGDYEERRLGRAVEQGESPFHLVEAGDWFGATVAEGGYALVGCTVAPGFDFADFEMAERAALSAQFPEHARLIAQLTRS